MADFVVFVKSILGSTSYLYTVKAEDLDTAEGLVRNQFNKDHSPDDQFEWDVIGFSVEFGLAKKLTRIDQGM